MRVNSYAVVSRAVEEGVETGWRRAHKHTDTPSDASIRESIVNEVTSALSEVVDWDSPAEDMLLAALEHAVRAKASPLVERVASDAIDAAVWDSVFPFQEGPVEAFDSVVTDIHVYGGPPGGIGHITEDRDTGDICVFFSDVPTPAAAGTSPKVVPGCANRYGDPAAYTEDGLAALRRAYRDMWQPWDPPTSPFVRWLRGNKWPTPQSPSPLP